MPRTPPLLALFCAALVAAALAAQGENDLIGRAGPSPRLIRRAGPEPRLGLPSRWSGLADAPESAHALVDPYQGQPAAAAAGRKLFLRHCAGCHGAGARGGEQADAPPLDSERVQAAPPGDLFWFLTNGNLRTGMPSWSRLPEAQRWQLVAFLRTLRGN
ncbi:MAG TPA: cytochrome c [Thermoanaerobaculia bacterium]|nr:cytochrome c [Thermoanaerobaculia bacterium]